MAERVLGLETEYGLTVDADDAVPSIRERVVDGIFQVAMQNLPHIPRRPDGGRRGLFLGNGSLLYVDCGLHIEFATPECFNPDDVVRYTLAGERILNQLTSEYLDVHHQIRGVVFLKTNVDYAYRSGSSWGCHESLLHKGTSKELSKQLIPHLVSRQVFTGSGGWNSLIPGLEFLISPRVVHLVNSVSNQSTHDRGIFHTKDEPLSSVGYHRLHLLCGESLCSETASWLKIGTTALVVAMIEAGLRPGDAVAIRLPCSAMQTIARDPTCTVSVPTATNGHMSALEIQRHYLEAAEAHLDDGIMPSWAERVCHSWRDTLDALQNRTPSSMERVLDWPLKLAIFRRHVERSGFSWEEIDRWNSVVKEIHNQLTMRCVEEEYFPGDFEQLIGSKSRYPGEIRRWRSSIEQQGMSWDRLMQFLKLKAELVEIDVRFSQVGTQGIFASLDRAGLLSHHVKGIDDVEHAVSNPPAQGRASQRGRVVQQLTKRMGMICGWSGICDLRKKQVLDLSDPFENEECWMSLAETSIMLSGEYFGMLDHEGAIAERRRMAILGSRRRQNQG